MMIKIRTSILTILMMLFTAVTAVAQASLSVQAPGQVIQGRNFTITYRLVNAEGTINTAPELKGCVLRYGPAKSTMQSYEFINGKSSSTTTYDYSFTYYAEKAGTVTIPSMSINVDGKTLKSQPKTITILPPDKSAQQDSRQSAGNGAPAGSVNGGNVKKISPNDLIVTVTLSKNHIYEQEAVIATIKVYTKHNISSFRATTLPSFDGFLSEELEVHEQPKIEHFRGDNYYSAVLKRCLLYPQKSGTLTINSGRYDVTLETYEEISNGFFITRRPIEQNITTVSNQVSVSVSPLPQPQPADFSGAVGHFSVNTTLEPQTLRTNEAATFTYTVNGTGNIKYLKTPDIDFGPGVEEYDPESESDAHFNGSDMTGTFTATYTIVPQQVGDFHLGAQKFVYFDPAKKQYVTLDIPAYSRRVAKGTASAATTVQQTGIDQKIDDILYIKPLKGEKLEEEQHRDFYTTLYLLCYILVAGALIATILIYRRQLKLNADVAGRRTARANRVANKRLKIARAEMQRHNNEAFYAALSAALWGYISDKLRIPSSALTRDNISEKLTEAGATNELIDQTIHVLDECEMARFTPEHSDTEVSTLYQNATDVINGLEATKRNKQ
jgi:hypothetical protein